MARRKEPEPAPRLETAVETCARLGLKAGDLLTSSLWDRTYKIKSIELDGTLGPHLIVERMETELAFEHMLLYLPSDVKRLDP